MRTRRVSQYSLSYEDLKRILAKEFTVPEESIEVLETSPVDVNPNRNIIHFEVNQDLLPKAYVPI